MYEIISMNIEIFGEILTELRKPDNTPCSLGPHDIEKIMTDENKKRRPPQQRKEEENYVW